MTHKSQCTPWARTGLEHCISNRKQSSRRAIGSRGPLDTFAGCHKPQSSFRIPAVRASRSIFCAKIKGGRNFETSLFRSNRSFLEGVPNKLMDIGHTADQFESMFNLLKQFPTIATRYYKTVVSMMGFLCLAAVNLWLLSFE